MTKKVVAIQVAMKEEGLGFAKKLNLIEQPLLDEDFGFRHFHGNFGRNLEVHLFLQGTDSQHGVEQIGLEPAAVCATLLIKKLKPTLLFNFGTAGSFTRSGYKMGEPVLVESSICFHDRRVPIPGYGKAQEGAYGVAEIMSRLRDALSLKSGRLSSGSSLELSARDAEVLELQRADLKDMEGAAIAWVAEKTKTPFISLKAVTDFVDLPEKAEDQFLANLEMASRNVQVAALSVLGFLDGDV